MLSSFDKNINNKICKVSVPLQSTNIKINYGIKTGANEAFIIAEDIKALLIKKDEKNADLIRPLIRGRDVKRFGYIDPKLYIICTFPYYKINIENYPSLKNYLLSFGMKRLEQTGNKYIVDGIEIKARKRTSNKWFETQDCINYADDFLHQKLVYTPVNSEYRFALIPPNVYFTNSLFMITGDDIEFLCGLLNSKLYRFFLKVMFSNGQYLYGSSSFFSTLPVIKNISYELKNQIINIVYKLCKSYDENLYEKLNEIVFKIYNINIDEIDYINSIIKD